MERNITLSGGKGSKKPASQVLNEFDATPLIGIKVIVHGAAVLTIDEDGEETVEVPQLKALLAAVAVLRCLTPIKLRGYEIKAMRKIMGLTGPALAKKLDSKTAPETISRWESETQPMGGYAEKVFRLLVCEALHAEAPAIGYEASKIAEMCVLDPWIMQKDFEVPAIHLRLVKAKQCKGDVVDAYTERDAA